MTKTNGHPDANLLAAFAEHALNGAERTNVLAHLADCARCRGVVYLAQEAAENEAASVEAVSPSPARGGWFNWRFAAVAAVLLMSVGVAGWLAYQHTEKRGDTNEAVNKGPRPQSEQAMMVEPETRPEEEKSAAKKAEAHNAPSPVPSPAPARKAMPPAEAVANPSTGGIATAALPAVAELPATEGGMLPAPVPTRSSATHYEAAPKARQLIEQERGVEQQRMQSAAAKASLRNQSEMTSYDSREPVATAQADASTMKMESLDSGSAPGAAYPVHGSSAEMPHPAMARPRANSSTALPGGGAVASSLVAGGNELALDENGKLFLSPDGGASWRTIRKQWKGKAIVLLNAPGGGKGGAAVLLRNESNHAWMSTDGGETWSPYSGTNSTDESSPSR